MTVLAANKTRPVKAPPGGCKFRVIPLVGYTHHTAAHTVYKGSIVVSDASVAAGYYHAAAAATGNVADIFGGIAMEKEVVPATALADGVHDVTVAVDGVWKFANEDTLTIADEGKPAYAQDDDNVNVDPGTGPNSLAWWIGYVINVDASFIWVDIKPACGALNVAPT